MVDHNKNTKIAFSAIAQYLAEELSDVEICFKIKMKYGFSYKWTEKAIDEIKEFNMSTLTQRHSIKEKEKLSADELSILNAKKVDEGENDG